MLEATHFSRTAHGIETEAVERAVGKTAKVTQIPEHGLVIVKHEAARRGQVWLLLEPPFPRSALERIAFLAEAKH